jgi:hypothetical protein
MLRPQLLMAIVLLICGATAAVPGYAASGRMGPEEAQVIADYWIRSYLRRAPDPGEERYWAGQLLQSPPAHVLSALLSSEEYLGYAGGTRYGLIRQLIADVGHREASAYEIEGRLRQTAGLDSRAIAYEFLRRYPRNWWPGPAATPPRELRHFYHSYGGYHGDRW